MKWLTFLFLIMAMSCNNQPTHIPKTDTPGYVEERYYLGAKKDKFVLTITTYDVHSHTDYRMEPHPQQKFFDTYEEMIQEIKNRKKAITR